MRRLLNIIFAIIFSASAFAQLQVWKDGKVIYQKPVAEVDSMTFGDNNQYDDQMRNLDYLFDLDVLAEVKISVTLKDWNQFLENIYVLELKDAYVPAQFDFTKGTETWHRDSVGLRPRGNTSFRCAELSDVHQKNSSWQPAHFGVKFTEYASGERFFGMDRIIFKFFKDDHAFCREVFCYDLFRRFGVWSAPHVSYCRFSIYVEGDSKPVYLGVYAMIENPRNGWLDDRQKDGYIPDTNGNMWKCAINAELNNTDKSLMGLTDGITYELKTNKTALASAQNELCDFINGLKKYSDGSNNLKQWLETNVDVDLLLREMAVNVAVGGWDEYWVLCNNYFFYFDSNHKFYYIPFDYDNTLGTCNQSGNPGTQNPLYWGSRGEDRMLLKKVLSIKEYEDRYKAYLKEIVSDDELMSPDGAIARIKKWHAMISPYIANDTRTDDYMTTHYIEDVPGYWGWYGNYRLLSGAENGDGQNKETNFFKAKKKSIDAL